jgi:dihydroxynaphthoic acid synthetase
VSQQFEDIIYEVRGRAAWVIINRPKLYNAFRAQTIEELIAAFKLAADDRQVACVVLTGAGDKAFCTGGDQSAHEGQYDGRGIVGLPIDEFQSIIRDIPKVVIARVNGFAIGGGNVFATLCDLTIAADTAKFGQVGPKVGSVDGGWGTALLARHIGDKKAREMWFLNEQYTAQQACEMGLDRDPRPAFADRAGARQALVQRRQRIHSRDLDDGAQRGKAVLRHCGIEGRSERLQRAADARFSCFREVTRSWLARSSSAARSPARSTPRRCRRTCR